MSSGKILKIKPLGFPWETQDPFLFCAYHRDEYPKGNAQMGPDPAHLSGRQIGSDFVIKDGWRMYHGGEVPGFPYHPHRGFETITINKEGLVDHTDSLGAAGRFGAGDVQWMTAGKGLQHSEMFPLVKEDQDNPLEIFQVWLNLPARSKMVDPHFKMLWGEEVPVVTEQDDQGLSTTYEVIAGTLNGTQALPPTPNSWAADPANGVGIFTVKMQAGATWTLPAAAEGINRSLYFYRGTSLQMGAEGRIDVDEIAELDPTASFDITNGASEGYFLVLEGKPIGEPIAQYGPFVMNTTAEIQQAINEYQQTQFGGWPWPEREQTHPRDKGRFALYADGTEEVPNG